MRSPETKTMSSQPKRPSPASSPPPPQQQNGADLKLKIINSLNKLSDRDTQAIAASELEAIAKSLTNDSFPTFLNCLHQTDASSKPTVRRQVVRLLSTVSSSHGGDVISPHLPKLVSTLTRRLRDPDSSVRSACVVASGDLSVAAEQSPVLLRSLLEVLTGEQDAKSQAGAAMCMTAAVESAPEGAERREVLRKALPRLGKLVTGDGFKPKGAILGLIGSVVGAGGASGKGSLDWVVPCLVGFLSSQDWAARKAAAEALGRVAVRERELAREFRSGCLASLEKRRFDKVKVVRETMNRTLTLWKEVPSVPEEIPPAPSPGRSPVSDNCNSIGASPPSATKRYHDVGFKTPLQKKTVPANRSLPSDAFCVTTARKQSIGKSNDMNITPGSHLDQEKKAPTRKIEVAGLTDLSRRDGTIAHDSEVPRLRGNEDHGNSKPETKHVLFSSMRLEKLQKIGGLKSGRVVPCVDDEICYSKDVESSRPTEEVYDDHKDYEDLSLIKKQLIQIENQQSNLLSILQRFIGKSQSGLNSLETRVNGLEMAVDEISYDLALSSGRIQHTDFTDNTCCKLPGTEFLSPKFWRRTEGRMYASKFTFTENVQDNMIGANQDAVSETYFFAGQRFNHRATNGPFVNPSTEISYGVRTQPGFSSSQFSADLVNDNLQVCNARGFNKPQPLGV